MIEDEKKWLNCTNEDNEKFIVTTKSELDRTTYFLYKFTDSGWKRIAKNKDPSKFDEIIFKEIEE